MHDQATVELRHAGPFPSPGFALRLCLGKSWAGNGKGKGESRNSTITMHTISYKNMSLDEISCMCQHAWRIWLHTCKLALTLKYPREETPLQDLTYYSSTNSTFWLNHWCKPWVPTTPPTLFLATQVNKARRSSWQTSNCRTTEKHYGKQSNFPWALASTKFQLQRSCTLDGGPPRSPVKHCSTVDVGNRWKIHGRSLPLHLIKGSQAFSKDLWRIRSKKQWVSKENTEWAISCMLNCSTITNHWT